MPDAPDFIVRPCLQQDLEQVTLIYGHHVLTGTGTFELEPPSEEEMEGRWTHIVTSGWPYLVASSRADPSRVLGFAYAGQFRPRPAYAQTFEDSIYVAPAAQGRGVGKRLLYELVETLRGDGVREILALIGDGANTGSIAVHASLGFKQQGVLRQVGFKFGRWLDVVVMQRSVRASPSG